MNTETKVKSRDHMRSVLERKYPDLFVSTTEEFNGWEGGLWLSGEDGAEDREGWPLFDYWADDYEEKYYVMGVRKHLEDWANRNGWFFEWYDGGTIMMWLI